MQPTGKLRLTATHRAGSTPNGLLPRASASSRYLRICARGVLSCKIFAEPNAIGKIVKITSETSFVLLAQAGLAYQRLCPDCREIDTSDSDDSADYGEGEIFDIFNAVMQSTSKGEDVHLPARNHPQRDAAAPASHRYRSAYENYDTPSSSDDHASEPECVDEHKEHAQHLKRGGAWDEASCSIGHGRDGARLNAYAARATHQNYDSLSSDEESGESGPDADVKYDQHAPRASYDCVKDFTAEDVEDALENLEEEKASLHAELQKMLQQNPRNEQRCKIMEAFQKGQLALKRRRNFFIRKRDELGQSGTEVKVSDEFSLAQQRADAAMRELLEEEEQEKKKAQHRGDDRDKTLQAEASGLPAPEDQEGTAEVIGREAAQGREAADLGEGDGDGRKLSKSERKKLLEEKRAEALRQKKAEKRFLQRQRRKQERDEALGGRAADGGDELDLTSAFALSNKAADKSAAGNGAPRFRGSRVIVMHADVTVEAHEQAACGGRPEEPKEGKRKAKLKKKRPAPSDPSNAATGHSVESEQAAAACMTSSTQGSRADVSAHDSGSRSADSFHPAPEEDPASKLRDMGFSVPPLPFFPLGACKAWSMHELQTWIVYPVFINAEIRHRCSRCKSVLTRACDVSRIRTFREQHVRLGESLPLMPCWNTSCWRARSNTRLLTISTAGQPKLAQEVPLTHHPHLSWRRLTRGVWEK